MRLLVPVLLVSAATGGLLAQDSRGWLNLGVTEFKSNNYTQAVADFQRAVDADPSNGVAHLYLGSALMQMFNPGAETPENLAVAAASNKEFLKVLELDPSNITAMNNLGSLALNQKKWDEAQSWYQKVVAADPSNSNAWYSMGFIAWSRYYPAVSAARVKAGMKLDQAGPLPASAEKDQLKAAYGLLIEGGIYDLQQALVTDPQYDDAMAYMNLLIRERADLRDNAADYRQDIDAANAWVDKALAVKRAKVGTRNATGMAAPPPPPPPPPPGQGGGGGGQAGVRDEPGRIRVSGEVMQAMLVRHDAPVYPADAKSAGISGSVELSVVVGADGAVKDVTFRGGPQALSQAAIDAVRTWVYKPTMLNDEPVEVDTSVTVNFTLAQE
jgi:TonB family protein